MLWTLAVLTKNRCRTWSRIHPNVVPEHTTAEDIVAWPLTYLAYLTSFTRNDRAVGIGRHIAESISSLFQILTALGIFFMP